MSKITFIYAYENEEWSTPMAIAREFESRGWEIDFVSIGSNKTGRYNDIALHEWINSKKETDIVMFMDWGRFDSKFLDKNLKKGFWVQESGDDPQNFDKNFPKAERFHITLSPDNDSVDEYKKRGINAYWFTHFADTRVHFPIEKEHEYVAVTTRGTGGSRLLDVLTQHGEGSFGNKNGLDSKEHTEFLNSGLMVVQNSRWREITRRIFEGMACKKLVLTDRLNESKKLHELFIEGQEIIFYDDIVECINKINHFSKYNKVRDGIAEKGYEKVMKYHTQIQRVDFIIEKYLEWKEKN